MTARELIADLQTLSNPDIEVYVTIGIFGYAYATKRVKVDKNDLWVDIEVAPMED